MTSPRTEIDRLRTPREDRSAMVEPPLDAMTELVDENLRIRDQLDYDLQGRSLAEISHLARRELLIAARRWTAAYRDVPATEPDPNEPIYLAGHQPQMFHPGVWFKNFALDSVARRHGATAVNLIVDNDVLSAASIRVPGGSVCEPNGEQIAFDQSDPKVPYEERRIEDRELLATFGRRAAEQIAPLVADPLLAQYWPLVVASAKQTDRLGACLAQGRHRLEAAWGLETLEVPQSEVCSGEAFQWFTAYLLARLPDFRTIYNEAVREYRRIHHVRSSSHPAPELAEDGEWLESPFWTWTAASPRRRRLFARSAGDEIVLCDRQSWEVRLPLRSDGDASPAVDRLMQLQREGVRIRSRALITTLWARLALGDLFIHGIGGAKYDRVTDRLIERFFRRSPPRIAVVSATLLLPIERERVTPDDARSIQQALRGLTYHPERYLDGPDRAALELIDAKRRWISTPPTAENARQRCHAIREANFSLQPLVESQRRQLVQRQTHVARHLKAEELLAWREYAFCLYPEATLQNFFSRLLHKIA